ALEVNDGIRDRSVPLEADIAVARSYRKPRDLGRMKSRSMQVELRGAETVGPALGTANELGAQHVTVERIRALPVGDMYDAVVEADRQRHRQRSLMRPCGVHAAERAITAASHPCSCLRPEDVIRARTAPSHVSATRPNLVRNDGGPRQHACRGPYDCSVRRNGPFKMRCKRFFSSWSARRPSPGLPRCHVLLLPGRRCGCALGRRTRLLDAIAASGVHVFYAHATSSHWAGSSVPFIRCISRRAVPLARITWVL